MNNVKSHELGKTYTRNWGFREVGFGLHEHTGSWRPTRAQRSWVLTGSESRLAELRVKEKNAELSSFAWAVAVSERMGVVNGRSCEKSKLKYLSPWFSLLWRVLSSVVVLGLLGPVIQNPLSKKATKSGHSLHEHFWNSDSTNMCSFAKLIFWLAQVVCIIVTW